MKRVLFADDDILTLNKLRNIIPWNLHDYEVIGQATDGDQTLHLVEELQPDLLILDIDMPKKNGVEVTKALHQKNNKIQILILSNFDNFDFVRTTMRYGVCDYLLKHQLDAKLLIQKIQEIAFLQKKEEQRSSQEDYFAGIAKQQYLQSIICNISIPEREQALMAAQPEFSSKCSVLAVMQITNFVILSHFNKKDARGELVESILNLAMNLFTSIENGLIAHIQHGRFVILFHFKNEVSQQKILQTAGSYVRLVSYNIQKLLSIHSICETSNILTDTSQIRSFYDHTLARLEKRPFRSKNVEPIFTVETKAIDILDEKRFMDALVDLDFCRMETHLLHIFDTYINSSLSDLHTQEIICHLLQIGSRFLKTHSLPDDLLTPEGIQNVFRQNLELPALKDLLLEYYKKLLNTVLDLSIQKYSPHVQSALQYIHTHYTEDISLSRAAEEIEISGAHLSRLFTKEVGTSFVEYMTNFRIEAAKRLLKQGAFELKDICAQVGFHNYNYFLRVFKEKTGYTPTQMQRM